MNVPTMTPGQGMPPPQGKAGPAPDPFLEQRRQEVEAKLSPELKDGYTRIVTAGLALLFSDETHEHVRKALTLIQQRGNQPNEIANGMVNLLSMIAQESQGKMPWPAAIPALFTLTTYVLEYMKDTQGLKVTPALVSDVGASVSAKLNVILQHNAKHQGAAQTTPASPPPGGMLAQNPASMTQGGAA